MTELVTRVRLRTPSPALIKARAGASPQSDASVARRIGWIWGLLFLNVLTYSTKSALLPLPTSVGKMVTQGALGVALILAVSINRRALVRPNLFLLFMTILCVTSVMMSVRGYFAARGLLYERSGWWAWWRSCGC